MSECCIEEFWSMSWKILFTVDNVYKGCLTAILWHRQQACYPRHPRRPRASQSGQKKRRDESFHVRAKGPLGTDSHRTISKNSSTPDWAQKIKCFVFLCPIGEQFLLSSIREFVHDCYCFDHGLSGSCTREMHSVRKLSVWYKITIWFQNTVCPKTRLSLQQVFTLASVTSCVTITEFFKDITAADVHENVAWKSELTFFQSVTPYFVKCKRTLLELNLYQPYPSSWRQWILSLLVYVLHKTWN